MTHNSTQIRRRGLKWNLRDIRLSNTVMGGIRLVFPEGFKQKIQVVLRKPRSDQINVNLVTSNIWSNVKNWFFLWMCGIYQRLVYTQENFLNYFYILVVKLWMARRIEFQKIVKLTNFLKLLLQVRTNYTLNIRKIIIIMNGSVNALF